MILYGTPDLEDPFKTEPEIHISPLYLYSYVSVLDSLFFFQVMNHVKDKPDEHVDG